MTWFPKDGFKIEAQAGFRSSWSQW